MKSSPVLPGGLSVNKPTWPITFAGAATSAFFMATTYLAHQERYCLVNAGTVFVTIAVAAIRFIITPRLNLPTAEGSYEAFAHLYVGGLFGAWVVDRTRISLLVQGVAVSLLELVMFIIQKNF